MEDIFRDASKIWCNTKNKIRKYSTQYNYNQFFFLCVLQQYNKRRYETTRRTRMSKQCYEQTAAPHHDEIYLGSYYKTFKSSGGNKYSMSYSSTILCKKTNKQMVQLSNNLFYFYSFRTFRFRGMSLVSSSTGTYKSKVKKMPLL